MTTRRLLGYKIKRNNAAQRVDTAKLRLDFIRTSMHELYIYTFNERKAITFHLISWLLLHEELSL